VLTGRGADVIIIDAPLKPEEALVDTLTIWVMMAWRLVILRRLPSIVA